MYQMISVSFIGVLKVKLVVKGNMKYENSLNELEKTQCV